jgi:hypothetical protein
LIVLSGERAANELTLLKHAFEGYKSAEPVLELAAPIRTLSAPSFLSMTFDRH